MVLSLQFLVPLRPPSYHLYRGDSPLVDVLHVSNHFPINFLYRPPDTPSGILDSPLDSPLADTNYLLPRGFPLGRRPTMVPGMAHARRKGKVRQDRPRSLPSDLEELRKGKTESLYSQICLRLKSLYHSYKPCMIILGTINNYRQLR